MKKSPIVMGVVCGLAATAWLACREPDTAEDAREARVESARERREERRWLPWQRDRAPEVAPEIASADAAYEGPWVEIPVEVVDVDGRPVSGADVEVRAWPEEWATAGLSDEAYDAWLAAQEDAEAREAGEESEDEAEAMARVATGRTDRKGVFRARVKPDVEVVFHARDGAREGRSEAIYAPHPDDWADGEAGLVARVEIGEAAILAGTVRDELGRPIEGAWMEVWPLDPESPSEAIAEETADLTTDENGRFRIELRSWGAFEVTIEADGMRTHVEPAVQLVPGRETELHVTLEARAELAGVVLDERGHPVPSARVVALDEEGSVDDGATTDVEGRFRLDVAAATHLQVEAAGFRPAFAPVANGGELRITRGGTVSVSISVSGEILEASGSSAQIYVASLDGEVPMASGEGVRPHLTIGPSGRHLRSVALGEGGVGSVTLEGLPPGRFRFTVVAAGAIAVYDGVVVHDGGETALVARIPGGASGTIEGTVRAARPVEGGSVYLSAPGQVGVHARVLAGGRFRFDAVPAGEWTLTGTIDLVGAWTHVDPRSIRIAAGERREFPVTASDDLSQPDAAEEDGEWYGDEGELFAPDLLVDHAANGLLVMRSGPEARGLFGGDRIVSVDGQELASLEDFERGDLLAGDEGSICRIVALRPATGETITVSLPRTRRWPVGHYD